MPSHRVHRKKTLSSSLFLDVPAAYGPPLGRAVLRRAPEDFVVREWLGFEADGEGDHVLLRVRKRGANTFWVAKQLARIAKVAPHEVGYAGLKDRDAVAEQCFTVPLRSAIGSEWAGVSGEGFEVLSAARHRRKLKRGSLRGNEFAIVLRELSVTTRTLEERLRHIAEHGVPNYFGPQRFGRAGNNLETARRWFQNGASPDDRLQRGFAISAARSALFNVVLAERVRVRSWNTLQRGDLANLDGSGSIFSVDDVDPVLAERCRTLDIHPTGPLWHGDSSASGAVRDLEREVASRFAVFAEGLARVGLEPERRALRIRVADLKWSIAETNVTLTFRLTKGAFATAVLHEIVENAFESDMPDGE